MTASDPGRTGEILYSFLSILFEGAPYILVGTLLSGFIDAFLPAKLLDRMLPKNKILATFSAGFMGLIFPVCECAVVPVVRRLVQKGLPISCAMTYLLSAPIINPIVVLSTWTAFQNPGDKSDVTPWVMTVGRISLGYLIAVVVGLAMLRKQPADILNKSIVDGIAGAGDDSGHAAKTGFDAKLIHAMRTAMRDFLDTAMYFTIGILITSIFNTQIDQTKLKLVAGNDLLAAPALMGLAYILALCSTSDAFIAAPMVAFSYAAKLAFLVFGPMLDIKLTFMYASVFRRKFLVGLALALFVLVWLLSGPWAALMQRIFTHPS
jgi:uncharacterized membrane protein YraQ (UPF0718 family)